MCICSDFHVKKSKILEKKLQTVKYVKKKIKDQK